MALPVALHGQSNASKKYNTRTKRNAQHHEVDQSAPMTIDMSHTKYPTVEPHLEPIESKTSIWPKISKFLLLSREVRDMIYSYVEEPALLATNSQIHEEFSQSLYGRAVLLARLDSPSFPEVALQLQRIHKDAQWRDGDSGYSSPIVFGKGLWAFNPIGSTRFVNYVRQAILYSVIGKPVNMMEDISSVIDRFPRLEEVKLHVSVSSITLPNFTTMDISRHLAVICSFVQVGFPGINKTIEVHVPENSSLNYSRSFELNDVAVLSALKRLKSHKHAKEDFEEFKRIEKCFSMARDILAQRFRKGRPSYITPNFSNPGCESQIRRSLEGMRQALRNFKPHSLEFANHRWHAMHYLEKMILPEERNNWRLTTRQKIDKEALIDCYNRNELRYLEGWLAMNKRSWLVEGSFP